MRARNIKPSFFKNPDLGECSPQARLGFIGLWCMADREGRVLDRAKLVKAELFPYDNIDTEAILCELAECGLIKRYEAKGQKIIWIVNFAKHQSPHFKEKPSDLPAFCESLVQAPTQVGASTDLGRCQHPLNPDSGSLNPDCGILIPDMTANDRDGVISQKPPKRVATGFDQWYATYPKKVGKDAAAKAYARAIKSIEPTELLAASIPRLTELAKRDPQFIPHPATWLNSGGWQDDITAITPAAKSAFGPGQNYDPNHDYESEKF